MMPDIQTLTILEDIMGKVNSLYQDQVEKEYDRGGKDAYYNRRPKPPEYDDTLKESYMAGYDDKPFGEKDHGYEHE